MSRKRKVYLLETHTFSVKKLPRIPVPAWIPPIVSKQLLALVNVQLLGVSYLVPITTQNYFVFEPALPETVRQIIATGIRRRKPEMDMMKLGDVLRDIVHVLLAQTSARVAGDLTESLMGQMTRFLDITFRKKLFRHVSARVARQLSAPQARTNISEIPSRVSVS